MILDTRQIRFEQRRARARGSRSGQHLFGARLFDVGQREIEAALRKLNRNRRADATARTGHDRQRLTCVHRLVSPDYCLWQ